jgi:hypothetical protein
VHMESMEDGLHPERPMNREYSSSQPSMLVKSELAEVKFRREADVSLLSQLVSL